MSTVHLCSAAQNTCAAQNAAKVEQYLFWRLAHPFMNKKATLPIHLQRRCDWAFPCLTLYSAGEDHTPRKNVDVHPLWLSMNIASDRAANVCALARIFLDYKTMCYIRKRVLLCVRMGHGNKHSPACLTQRSVQKGLFQEVNPGPLTP